MNILDKIQRKKSILDYGETQNTINKNNLAKVMDNTSINILLIDDDKDILYTFHTILNSQGYTVKAFSDRTEALEHVIRKGPYFYEHDRNGYSNAWNKWYLGGIIDLKL